jgi:hypothetical protein
MFRRIKSLALAAGLTLCAVAAALGADAAPAVAASVPITLTWGDMVTALITAAGGPMVIMTVVVGLGMRLLARVNAPLAAAAKDAGIDRLIENAGAHALATTEGTVSGKSIEISKAPPVVARMVNFGVTYGPALVNQLGGTKAFEDHSIAWLSKNGYLPADFNAATLASPPATASVGG